MLQEGNLEVGRKFLGESGSIRLQENDSYLFGDLIQFEPPKCETITFRGHRNILGTHRNTLEITRDKELSRRGDCIIGVRASKACADIDEKLKKHIKSSGCLVLQIRVGDLHYGFVARGSPALEMSDEHEIVIRRSEYSSNRTLAVQSEAAAIDIPRSIIRALQNPAAQGKISIMPIPSEVEAAESTHSWFSQVEDSNE